MGNHRAPRRGLRVAPAGTSAHTQGTPSVGGKRKAVKPAPVGGALTKLPSPQVLVGVAALAVSATGAVTVGQADEAPASAAQNEIQLQANALSGVSAISSSADVSSRSAQVVSRDSRRDALEDATAQEVEAAAEAEAEERDAALARLAATAEKHSSQVELNLWHLPVSGYRLTASFGQSGSNWSRNHTGLDFAAPTGTNIRSVNNGTITEVGYAGSYGNRIIVTADDGTEIWYCHLSGYLAEVGDVVRGGEVIGLLGSTGNSTGPHLHLEVRPGGGDPVDPRAALIAHGVRP